MPFFLLPVPVPCLPPGPAPPRRGPQCPAPGARAGRAPRSSRDHPGAARPRLSRVSAASPGSPWGKGAWRRPGGAGGGAGSARLGSPGGAGPGEAPGAAFPGMLWAGICRDPLPPDWMCQGWELRVPPLSPPVSPPCPLLGTRRWCRSRPQPRSCSLGCPWKSCHGNFSSQPRSSRACGDGRWLGTGFLILGIVLGCPSGHSRHTGQHQRVLIPPC